MGSVASLVFLADEPVFDDLLRKVTHDFPNTQIASVRIDECLLRGWKRS